MMQVLRKLNELLWAGVAWDHAGMAVHRMIAAVPSGGSHRRTLAGADL